MRSRVQRVDLRTGMISTERPRWRMPRLVHRFRWFICFVLAPTLLVAIYFFGFAADQYESEAHFYVAGGSSGGSGSGSSSGGNAGQMLNGSGASSASEGETLAVIDYLNSHDAVADLLKHVDLRRIYGGPEADFLTRLDKDANEEQIYRYLFQIMPKIDASLDFMNGVGVLKVRAFRPEDAHAVAAELMRASEKMMDDLTMQMRNQILDLAKKELKAAEDRVATVSDKVTEWRLHEEQMDPDKATATLFSVIGGLETNLAQARSDFAAARTYLKPDNPRYIQLENNVKALQGEIDAQKDRMTGAKGGMAPTVAAYDRLELDQTFAQQDYNSALGALESARLFAEKQELFIESVVQPQVAQEAEYPRRLMLLAIVFLGLTLGYFVVGLIVCGHS